MAGALSRSQISEDIQDYFRKDRGRNPGNNHTSVNTSRNKSPRNRDNPSKFDSLGILIDKPKHKQYSTLQSRIASFENWPQDKTQEVRQLAEAGFGYTGVVDSVRCFYCSIGLKDWPEGACPWEQHVLASPDCGHVIQCKGKGYIRKILGEIDQESDVDADDSDEVVDTVQLAINRNENAVIAAREYCTDENILKRAIKTLIKEDVQKKFSAVDLVSVIQNMEETNGNTNVQYKEYMRNILEESDQDSDVDIDDSDEIMDTVQLAINRNEDAVVAAREYCTDEDTLKRAVKLLIKKDCHKIFSAVEVVKVVQGIEEANGNTTVTAQFSEENLEETNNKLKELMTCKICFDGKACMITLPCGHMVCCSQCILSLTKCAICRTQIKGTVRALMPV